MSDENQEFDKYGRKIRKGSPLGFLSSMARGGKELPTEKPAAVQSTNEEQVEGDASPEFDKYGRKIRKGISLPVLPTVVLIAFVGGITAVLVNENQSGSSDSPKLEVTKKFGESDSEGHNDTSITRDASYQAFGFSLTDTLSGLDWGATRMRFLNPRYCKSEVIPEGDRFLRTAGTYYMCRFDTTESNHLGTRRCVNVWTQYLRETRYATNEYNVAQCTPYQ